MTLKRLIKLSVAVSIITAMSIFGAVACAPVTLLNTITPSSSFERAKNIAYGDLERQNLDIYRATKPRPNAPVLIFIHGGSWSEGSKDIYKFLAEGFTSEGYDVVVPNYRLYPEAVYPQMIQDSAKAVGAVIAQYPDRPVVIMGHSAGAYNALMLALAPGFLDEAKISLCETVAGFVSLAGPTGIIPLSEEPFITIFPDRFTAQDAPLNNVLLPAPPIFFGHGADDKTVYPQNSERLAEKIISRGGQAEVKVYEGMDHTEVVQVLSRHFDDEAALKSDIIDFIKNLGLEGANGYCH